MTLVKLENGRLVFCPKSGISGGYHHTNLPKYYADHPEEAKKDGWMELRETQRPDGNYYATYAIKNGEVVQEWRKILDPEHTIDPIEKLRADVDYIAMETGVDLEV
ncbi:MAG: hypothetical protein MJ000_11670 [Bacteroidales bacterium]|nr:hypothetical protein [Bacteroidales bacterium]